MKDEAGGNIILEFVGTRAKCYATKVLQDKEGMKKAKEVKKQVIHESLHFDHYKDCLSWHNLHDPI